MFNVVHVRGQKYQPYIYGPVDINQNMVMNVIYGKTSKLDTNVVFQVFLDVWNDGQLSRIPEETALVPRYWERKAFQIQYVQK